MSEFTVAEEVEPKSEIEPPKMADKKQANDSSGFGLVNWLFDHINERKPIFLSLYQEYESEVKLSSNHKFFNWIFLLLATIGDVVLFAVYAASVIMIIAGITYIFVKGTGIVELFQSTK